MTRSVIQHFATERRTPSRTRTSPGSPTASAKSSPGFATGRSNTEIAEELVVSPDTIRTHVSRAMVKLHARDRAQLVVFAIQSGLEPPGP